MDTLQADILPEDTLLEDIAVEQLDKPSLMEILLSQEDQESEDILLAKLLPMEPLETLPLMVLLVLPVTAPTILDILHPELEEQLALLQEAELETIEPVDTDVLYHLSSHTFMNIDEYSKCKENSYINISYY